MADKKKNAKPLNAGLLIAISVLMAMALFFQAIGCPYDVFTLHPEAVTDGVNGCYSVWGMKQCGGRHAIAWHDARFKTCGVFEATFKAAASFSIIALFATLMSALISFLAAYKCCVKTKTPLCLFLLFGIIATAVPWACVAGLYHNSTCNIGRMRDLANFAPGFAFFVVSFCLTAISFVISIFV